MYVHNTKLALSLFLLLLPSLAEAKLSNFASRSNFGIGIDGILEAKPSSDFATSPTSSASSYSHAFGLQPYGDFGNFVVKGDFSIHYAPEISGGGTDAIGKFTESSSSSLWSAGVILELIPYVAKDQRERIFIKIGAGEAKATLTNTRSYPAVTNVEKDSGTTEYYLAGAGYEFFLLQNYSLELGAGYQSFNFGKFSYSSGTQVNGNTLVNGATVSKTSGGNKSFDLSGFYFNLGLNLHF